jgi:hypothetical protein
MSKKSAANVPNRTLDEIREDVEATKATSAKLRRLVDSAMSRIRSSKFKPYVVVKNDAGELVRRRSPVFKDLREYETTLRSSEKHLARLRIEESAAAKQAAPAEESRFAKFAPERKSA